MEDTYHIPGWACRVAGGYKVPLGGLNLARVDSHAPEVKFSQPLRDGAAESLVAYARARGVACDRNDARLNKKSFISHRKALFLTQDKDTADGSCGAD